MKDAKTYLSILNNIYKFKEYCSLIIVTQLNSSLWNFLDYKDSWNHSIAEMKEIWEIISPKSKFFN
jgi:hypothetical protein